MGTEFSDIVISGRFVECLFYFGLGISYGFLITIAIDIFKNKRKAK